MFADLDKLLPKVEHMLLQTLHQKYLKKKGSLLLKVR